MFQFPGFASYTYVFSAGYPCGWVSPFRNLRIKVWLPTPRSLSQAPTSFIASDCQGIHRMRLVTWPYNRSYLWYPRISLRRAQEDISPTPLCVGQVLMNADAKVNASTRRMLWRLSHSMYILKTRFTDTGIENRAWKLLSKNYPHHLSEPKCWFLIQRLSLIYLVKSQSTTMSDEYSTISTKVD